MVVITLLQILLGSCLLFPGSCQVYRSCRCVNYRQDTIPEGSQKGIFHTPGYPDDFSGGKSLRCVLYKFSGPPNSIVEVKFDKFHLPSDENKRCLGFNVKIYLNLESEHDGINKATKAQAELCGVHEHTELYRSAGRTLVLAYVTKHNLTAEYADGSGFQGTYTFRNKSDFETNGLKTQGKCIYETDSETWKKGWIFSPGYPNKYPSLSNCAYTFSGIIGEIVTLYFFRVNLDGYQTRSGKECVVQDHLLVYDGVDELAPRLKVFCGTVDNVFVKSTQRHLHIRFIANMKEEGLGFNGTFQFKENQCKLFLESRPGETEGYFQSPSYPQTYEPGIDCSYELVARPNERIQLIFEDFDLQVSNSSGAEEGCSAADYITVVEPKRSPLGVYCGSIRPLPIMSSGQHLNVMFSSSLIYSSARGFRIQYRFVTDFGIHTGLQEDSECWFTFSRSVHVDSGSVYSPNYPGRYPHNTECTYEFLGNNRHVKITFHQFDVTGTPYLCSKKTSSDFIKFSNFKQSEDKKMSKMCSNLNTPESEPEKMKEMSILSDHDYFRLVFHSNSVVAGLGFNATFEFMSPPAAPSPAPLSDSKGHGLRATFILTTCPLLLIEIFLYKVTSLG